MNLGFADHVDSQTMGNGRYRVHCSAMQSYGFHILETCEGIIAKLTAVVGRGQSVTTQFPVN